VRGTGQRAFSDSHKSPHAHKIGRHARPADVAGMPDLSTKSRCAMLASHTCGRVVLYDWTLGDGGGRWRERG